MFTSSENNGAQSNDQTESPSTRSKRNHQSERVRDGGLVPSHLYEVDSNGLYQVSDELDAIRISEVDPSLLPLDQIANVASKTNAESQVTNLAETIVDEPRAGLLAAIEHDEKYLDFKTAELLEERSRLKEECLSVPYDIKQRDTSFGWQSMQGLEVVGLATAAVLFVTMAVWTAAADLTLVYDNLSIAFPMESGDIDFAAMYASDGGDAIADAPEETPIYCDPNAYKSIAIFSTLFVLFAWFDVMKVAPLSSYQSMPRGVFSKLSWLCTPMGRTFAIQLTLLLSAVAFNLRIGFELDLTASDIDSEPPISSATTYSLMAVALAFAAYAFLHWVVQIFERLCGVRELPNPVRLIMDERMAFLDSKLESVASIVSCFTGLVGSHEASKKRFVAECLSVPAGIQNKQREAAELAEAAAQQAAATARMKSLGASIN